MKRMLVGATLIVAGLVGVAGASPVSAQSTNPGVCEGTHITPPANTTEVTVTAPEGQLISGYCVKAGSENQGLGPEYVTLDEPATSVTIEYTMSDTVKDISHYVVTYVDAPPPVETTPVETTPTAPTEVGSNPPPATPAEPAAAPTVGSEGGSVTPDVASEGPLPAQAAPAQALPATGTSSWVFAFMAMALVLVGTGFVSFSSFGFRRRDRPPVRG